jgi:iron complex outermembrane receptor protein
MTKRGLYLATAISGILAVTTPPAVAQTLASPLAEQPADPDTIIVTAQRRSESLQSVPMSITALTGDGLRSAGVSSVQDIGLVTPGLVWAQSGGSSQPTIRGVGTRNTTAGEEPNVATFIDGVYQPEMNGIAQELANIERVEVLKGPQGTLFGRNATGGAINIVTRKPSFETTGEFTGSIGRFDYLRGTAYLSGPIISDKLAVSVAATGYKDDGYINNVFLNRTQGARKGTATRVKLLFVPSSKVEFQLNGMYVYNYDGAPLSGQAIDGNSAVRTPTALQNPNNIPLDIRLPTARFTTASAFVPYYSFHQYMVDQHLSIDLDWATLNALASYSELNGNLVQSSDVSPLQLSGAEFRQRTHAYNQEVTLTSSGTGRFTWLVGADGFQAKSFYDPLTLRSLGAGTLSRNGITTRAYAMFGEGTFELADHLFLTGGLRYSHDKKISYREVAPGTPASSVTGATKSFHDLSPRAVIRYQPAANLNLYASYTRGFKSGTFNPVVASGAVTPVRPEKVEAYEVGVKSIVAPGFTLNASAFHYRYTDLQVQVVVLLPGGAVATASANAPRAVIDGLELEGRARISPNFHLTGGLSLLRPKIKDFPNASILVPKTPGTGATSTANTCAASAGTAGCGNFSTVGNVAGNDLIRAPHWTISIGGDYETPLAGGSLRLDATAFFSGRYFNDLTNRRAISQPSYEVVNTSAGWTTPDGHWTFSVFGRNLTNQYYLLGVFPSGNLDSGSYAKPRWFGASARFGF